MSTATDIVSVMHDAFRREFFLLPGTIQGTQLHDGRRRRSVQRQLRALTASWRKYCDALDRALGRGDSESVTAVLGAHLETQATIIHAALEIVDAAARKWTSTEASRTRFAAEAAAVANAIGEYLADQAPLLANDSALGLPDSDWAAIVKSTLAVNRGGLLAAVLEGGQRAEDELVLAMTHPSHRWPCDLSLR